MPVRIALIFACSALLSSAEVASRATPVHSQPQTSAAVLLLVKPGETLPTFNAAVSAPAGWSAVSLAGPHEVFVENRFIGKDLDVKPGSPLHTEPKSTSPVLTSFAAGDLMEITGLRGRWTQLRLTKAVTGYVASPNAAAAASVAQTTPVVTPTDLRDAPPASNPTARSGTYNETPLPPRMGEAIARSAAERSSLAALPRLFEGRLKSTRVPLRPRRPYDYALETEEGVRFAYVDLSKLLLTEQIENYLHHSVVVYGVARPVPDTKDIVISVESFQLR